MMNLATETIDKWKRDERDLKYIISYIKNRIELLEHGQLQEETTLDILKGLQYFMELNSFSGELKDELDERIEVQRTKRGEEDPRTIIEELKTYQCRLYNNILSNFFSEEEKILPEPKERTKKEYYRVDFIGKEKHPIFYFGPGTCALEVLIRIKHTEEVHSKNQTSNEIHLEKPKESVINISKCPYFKIRKQDENEIGRPNRYRCSHKKAGYHFCSLSLSVERKDCPNLENLVEKEEDVFNAIISQIPTPELSEIPEI